MNCFPRSCLAALLVAAMPVVAAHGALQDAPPAAPPKAAPATDAPAKTSPQGEQVRREVDEAVDAIRGYSAELREQAVANAKRAGEDLDSQMARLQEQTDLRWDRMNQAARKRSQETMADLRQRRNALAEWYGGMRHSSSAAWDEVRTGFVSSYHELADALRNARAELGKDEKPAAETPTPPSDEKRDQ